MKNESNLGWIIVTLALLAQLAAYGAIGYVAYHFLSKLW
jgi:hypothetical protein